MKRLNNKKLAVLVLILIVIAGFAIAVISDGVTYCTKKFCGCQDDKDEVECNTCGVYKPVFFSILLNYGRSCQAREIVECSKGEITGRRYNIDKDYCSYIWNSAFTKNGNNGMVIFDTEPGQN
ncbi:MAG: hypothetical protein HY459_03480 [Parcubacteria group bacterium]|nr:hypothetical protein [Parcubacteria group bacterium]